MRNESAEAPEECYRIEHQLADSGGSLAAYALRITDIDPMRYNLLFERFLNPERVSMPDFDIDFCKDRRDEVLRYVIERYGGDNVAQIATFHQLKSKLVVRDVGRVLGMNYVDVDRNGGGDGDPAGCEPTELKSGGVYEHGTWINRELRDEKVVNFLYSLPQGKQTISYKRRAEIPGKFRVIPHKAYAMYAPRIRAISDSAEMTITP